MHKPLDDSAPDLERLTSQVKELERRVSLLEQGQETASAHPYEPEIRRTNLPLPESETSSARPAGAIRVVGQSILGIAGAYLLRAAAESGSFPSLAVVAVALAYAGGWLFGRREFARTFDLPAPLTESLPPSSFPQCFGKSRCDSSSCLSRRLPRHSSRSRCWRQLWHGGANSPRSCGLPLHLLSLPLLHSSLPLAIWFR